MSNIFQSLEHVYASAASSIVAEAKFLENKILPALKKVNADEATVEAVAGAIDPRAANIARIGFAALGAVIKALDDAGNVAAGSGLNVTFDQQFIADLKSIVPAVKSAAAAASPAVSK